MADSTPFEQAFNYQFPLVEGISEMALRGQWNYASKAKNLVGAEGATRLAVSELSRALDTLDYAKVLEVVWFLGVYRFEGLSQRFVLYQRPPNVETNLAVASAIFCGDIGGCAGDHPITLSLCFHFRALPCSSPPTDLYDAINQILTGHEIETYNSMTTRLTRLLNEYRRGDL